MTLISLISRLLLLVSALGLSGCLQMGGSPEDERHDPHYIAGKSRISSMDYDGAIAAFENALLANPKSAAAHLELGLLYEEKKNDHAAAIYHFQRHLELQPESNMSEMVKQHIISCKVDLARTVPFALVNQVVQDEIRHLTLTNQFLTEQVAQLRTELVQQAASYSNRLAAAASQAAFLAQSQSPPHSGLPTEPERRVSPAVERPAPPSSSSSPPRASSTPRSHVVKQGETLAQIARRYNIKLNSLQVANPSVEARRLRAGQVLNLPRN